MKLFQRWRRARSTNSAERDPVTPEPQPVAPVQRPVSRPVRRARRPATMGKSMAEQAYLAEAAQRAKLDG